MVFKMTKNILALLTITLGVNLAAVLTSAPARAVQFFYTADLNGANEEPPNISPATGTANLIYDDVARTLNVDVLFSGLVGNTAAAHIHAATTIPGTGTAGVATPFSTFPTGVTTGSYNITLDLTSSSSYSSGFLSANGGTTATAETALAASLAAGTSYFNLHTGSSPGGEIRGFFTPATPVPFESSAFVVPVCTGTLLGISLWKRKRNLKSLKA
jgi:hypothetical protein